MKFTCPNCKGKYKLRIVDQDMTSLKQTMRAWSESQSSESIGTK